MELQMGPDYLDGLLEKVQNDVRLLRDLDNVAKDSASSLGLLLRTPEPENAYKPIPVTLFPTFIKREAIDSITGIQSAVNLLMHQISLDATFVSAVLAGASQVDSFTKRLLDIYHQVDVRSQFQLGLLRTDYILHTEKSHQNLSKSLSESTYKMVEVNMICVGLAGISSFTSQVHNRIMEYMGLGNSCLPVLPESGLLYGTALSAAHAAYEEEYSTRTQTIMLLLVHKGFEFNVMDQRFIERESGMRTLRRTFKEAAKSMTLTKGHALMVEGQEVAVVYFRTGYSPDQYDDDDDWETRKTIEISRAIKCPSVAYQLVGSKKIQQELSRPEVLERFMPERSLQDQIRSTFVGQWDMGDPSSKAKIDHALAHPELYVLKPNREGGGNNFYHQKLVEKIQEIRGTSDALGYILMDKILAPVQKNIMIRPGQLPELTDTVNEIGVFGAVLAKGQEVYFNGGSRQILVRSKDSSADEGGLARGLSCLSSAFIV